MATFRAFESVSQAVIDLLRDHYDPDAFNQELEFRVYTAHSFAQPMNAGVSLFAFRVLPNAVHRTPPGRMGPDGRRQRSQLPLDLHFILTAWSRDGSAQQAIAAWMMRVLEDYPVLPAGLLNRRTRAVFRPEETAEVVPAELATEDLLHLWELLGANSYQLSVPYIARNVRIDSELPTPDSPPMQERRFEYVGERS